MPTSVYNIRINEQHVYIENCIHSVQPAITGCTNCSDTALHPSSICLIKNACRQPHSRPSVYSQPTTPLYIHPSLQQSARACDFMYTRSFSLAVTAANSFLNNKLSYRSHDASRFITARCVCISAVCAVTRVRPSEFPFHPYNI